jgi:hypothetical protein
MERIKFWVIAMPLLQALTALGAPAELRLPSLTAGENVYSNVVLTPSSGGRVLVRHATGLAAVPVSDLEARTVQQLTAAGVIRPPALAEPLSRAATNESAAKSTRGNMTNTASTVAVTNQAAARPAVLTVPAGSLAARVAARYGQGGWGDAGRPPWIAWLSTGLVLGMLAALVAFYVLRSWCLLRICRRALGREAWLVFVPFLRWFPLAEAAGMSRHWLLVPVFGFVGAYVPPPLPQAPWAGIAFGSLLLILWLGTIVLFFVWCVRVCQAVRCSGWLGVLLMLPLLEWIGLFYLAFGPEQPEENLPLGQPAAV